MMVVRTQLAQSAIHGIGVFAGEAIAAGTVVWIDRYEHSFTEEQVAAMPSVLREFVERFGYRAFTKPGMVFCGIDNGRFMNHSDDANVAYRVETSVALRDIAAGEELTCDYRELGDEGAPDPGSGP